MPQSAPLLLVDGSSYLFRAYHALPDLTTSDGFPTGAVRGVIGMLRKLAKDFEGSPIAVVFDAKGKTFRDEIFPEYKANRPPMAVDLRQQIEPIHEIIKAMGMPLLVVEGVEADDVIGTLARQATAAQRPVIISTSDKDMAQLVSEHVTLVNTMTEAAMDRDGVVAKFGVPPERIIDYLALIGDSVDNIPGIPKVGPKTAAKWLTEYGDLDGVIANAEAVKGKVGENLRAHLEQLPLSHELATIKCDVELTTRIEDLNVEPENTDELIAMFDRLEFKQWIEEMGIETTPVVRVEADYETIVDVAALDAWVDEIRALKKVAITLVTDTHNYMDADIVGVAFASAVGRAAYVPVGHSLAAAQLPLALVLDKLAPVLSDPAVSKIGQNLKFEQSVLARYDIDLQGIDFDTMLESYVLDSVGSRGHQFDDLATKHLDLTTTDLDAVAGKGAKRLPFSQLGEDDVRDYAAERADIVFRLHGLFWPRLQSTGSLQSVYEDIERPMLSVLSRIERTGTLVDSGLLGEQSRELAEGMRKLEEKAFELAGQEFNLGSPKQLQEILYDKLELPALRKTQKGQRSTAEPVLQELALEYELPGVILDYRSLSKLKSTYTDSLPAQINQRTGRIHTSYNQAVAATGRLSSADPNLQNIPVRTAEGRRIRQAFVAPPGYKLVAADYSQIELRIMAHLSGDEGLKTAFADGLDVHRATAAEVFGETLETVSDDHRRSAKAINFGLIYGMSAFGLGQQLGVSRNVAQEYIGRYFARYPSVKEYMDGVREQAHGDGFVETVFGRRLYLPEINARNVPRRQAAERTAINAPMQGSAADIIKRAMLAVDTWLADAPLDAKMIMQVHDELVFEVAEGDVAALETQASQLMAGAAELSVPLVVDVGVGDNWDEAH